MAYGYKMRVNLTYEQAVEKVKSKLATEVFGILTEIDVRGTVKKKLGLDFDKYVILGACNPPFAHKALTLEKDIGLLMPCNVIVYEDKGRTYIASVLPTVSMSMVNNPALAETAQQVEDKLKKVIDSV